MKQVGIFLAGFASGWVVRSTVDSSRGLAVSGISTVFGTVERLRRLVAIEREHLEDLVAEGRARYESNRDRTAAKTASDAPEGAARGRQPAVDIPRRGRAA